MLAGQKHLAVFHDVYVEDQPISKDVIPEKAFSSYVKSGAIKRFSKIYNNPEISKSIMYVCFTSPNEEWRADAFFWLHEQGSKGSTLFDDAYEMFVGRLLGYSETDILHFIEHQKSFKSAAA